LAQRSTLRRFWENFKALLSALLFFIFLRTFIVEAYRIPSGSMIPSLLIGDWLFVNKLVYGPHIPFTDINLPGYDNPERSDVVVFKSPPQSDQAWDPTPTLVKRLVGMPGDTVFMRGALLHVNGIPQRQGFAAAADENSFDSIDPLFDWQKRVGLAASRFGAAPAQPTHDNWGPIVVPAGLVASRRRPRGLRGAGGRHARPGPGACIGRRPLRCHGERASRGRRLGRRFPCRPARGRQARGAAADEERDPGRPESIGSIMHQAGIRSSR